jgi:hypothetical protein
MTSMSSMYANFASKQQRYPRYDEGIYSFTVQERHCFCERISNVVLALESPNDDFDHADRGPEHSARGVFCDSR